jgi:restriction system protein
LTDEGKKTFSVNKQEVSRAVKALDIVVQSDKSSTESEGTEISEAVWKEKLLNAIMSMKPNSFERFCQRLLRESGFIQVEVTGKSGDGGIDGKGIMRLGLLSFHVIFQCKRYKGSVPSKEIRDFRGAMVGRADKGLFITTGTFTRDSKSEACRDGAPPIDLIDGDQLIEKIKELGLGVKIKTEEVIEVNTEWFKFF